MNNKDFNFNCSKLINTIRKTIGPAGKEYFNKLKNGNSINDPNWLVPFIEYKDRYNKIDAHSIFGAALFFSSQNSLNKGDTVLASIGQYYSIFHIGYALASLDFNIDNNVLEQIRHSKLKNLIKHMVERGIAPDEFLNLYLDLQNVREYLNYLNVPSGQDKFILLRRGHKFHSICFGDIAIADTPYHAKESLLLIINNFFSMLQDIEKQIIRKLKSNNKVLTIFKSIRRISYFDWYGEDLMIDFFPDTVMEDLEHFLAQQDIDQSN